MIFITGTNTNVGKTVVTGLLARYLEDKNKNVITQKWVQTGASIPEDILTHLEYYQPSKETLGAFIDQMCPYVFEFPASPHFAAHKAGTKIEAERLIESYKQLKTNFDVVITEGSGGMLVPLNGITLIADIVKLLNLATILVAPNKLGVLSQVFTHVEMLFHRGISCVGIILTQTEETIDTPKEILENNLETLKQTLSTFIVEPLEYHPDIEGQMRSFEPIGDKIYKKLKKQGLL